MAGGLLRRSVTIIFVAFLVYYLVTRPAQSADLIATTLGAIKQAITSILSFFNSLASR